MKPVTSNFFAIPLILFAFIALAVPANGQLTAANKFDKAVRTLYVINDLPDTIFVYNENDKNWNSRSAVLKAMSPDSTNGWRFIWGKYNPAKKGYDTLQINDSVQTANLPNLLSGAYNVRMQKDTIDTVFRALVYINKLRFYLVKDSKGNVADFEYTCSALTLRAITKSDTDFPDSLFFHHEEFEYFDPYTQSQISTNTKLSFNWKGTDKSDNKTTRNFFINYNPPPHNTWFTAVVTDEFGNSASDKVYFVSNVTKAEFDIYHNTTVYDPYSADTAVSHYEIVKEDAAKGEAPFHAMFVNTSKNGIRFEWVMSDTLYAPTDSLKYFTTDSLTNVFHVYRRPYLDKNYNPGMYTPMLISISPYGCIDTFRTKTIEVEMSEIGDGDGVGDKVFPTAFKPDDAFEENRYFYFKGEINEAKPKFEWKSIRWLRLSIFDQRGNLVYEYNNAINDNYRGWDGITNRGLYRGMKAKQGLYYYVFTATGWGRIKGKTASTETDSNNNTNTRKAAATDTNTGTTGNNSLRNRPESITGKGYVYLFRD